MVSYPFWYISLFLFGGVVNLAISMVMFYLRSRGGTEQYTKSQLWALTILAWLFLLNFIIAICEVLNKAFVNSGDLASTYPVTSLWIDLSTFTGFLLLTFGLIYPRPFTKWSNLRMLVLGLLLSGILALAWDISYNHNYLQQFASYNLLAGVMVVAVFVPIFIWLSEYSRQPSKEGRMMYTLLIWGFMFAVIAGQVMGIVGSILTNTVMGIDRSIYFVLIILALIRLAWALWGHRKIWSTPETLHLVLLGMSFLIAILGGVVGGATSKEQTDTVLLASFMGLTFGWMVVRPVLFSYGLLRYRLLGSQIKAESAIAVLGGILMSTGVVLGMIGLANGQDNPAVVGGTAVVGSVLFYPFWMATQRLAAKFLPMSVGAEGVSMRERRNTYLMGLQTGVVRGVIADIDDKDALEELRKALDITEREHDLLMESVTQHEARLAPVRQVEEAFLVMSDGRLIGHSSPAHGVEGAKKIADSDIIAGMLTAITEFVGEAMKRGDTEEGSMGAISYGDSNLIIEREGPLVLAIVLRGADDLEVRQAMRDTLSDINERFGKVLNANWDGDQTGLDIADDIVWDLVCRLGTTKT
jgi:MFS family permease